MKTRWGRMGGAAWLALALSVGLHTDGRLCAQETKGWVGLGMRGGSFASQDLRISPVAQTGSGVSQLGATLQLETEHLSHGFEVWFGSLSTSSDDAFSSQGPGGSRRTPASTVTLGEVTYSLLFRTGPWGLGFATAFDLNHNEYEFRSGSSEGFLYAGSLQAEGRRDLYIGTRGQLVLAVRVPVLAWAARPTYSTVDEARLQASSDFFHRLSTAELAGPGALRGLIGRVEYRRPVSDRVGFRGGTRVSYTRHSEGTVPSRFTAVRFDVEIGLTLAWGGQR